MHPWSRSDPGGHRDHGSFKELSAPCPEDPPPGCCPMGTLMERKDTRRSLSTGFEETVTKTEMSAGNLHSKVRPFPRIQGLKRRAPNREPEVAPMAASPGGSRRGGKKDSGVKDSSGVRSLAPVASLGHCLGLNCTALRKHGVALHQRRGRDRCPGRSPGTFRTEASATWAPQGAEGTGTGKDGKSSSACADLTLEDRHWSPGRSPHPVYPSRGSGHGQQVWPVHHPGPRVTEAS